MPMAWMNRPRWVIAAVALAALTATGLTLFVREPGLSSDLANGTYSNDCCGTIELRDGQMTANGANWVSYAIEQDEQGPYILPRTFVGTQDRGIVLDGSRPVLKLRLDTLPNPTRIEVPGLWGPDSFVRTERSIP